MLDKPVLRAHAARSTTNQRLENDMSKTLRNGATEIARITISGKTAVMAKRDEGDGTYQPYATWMIGVDEDGTEYTYWGHYFEYHNEAVADMLDRV